MSVYESETGCLRNSIDRRVNTSGKVLAQNRLCVSGCKFGAQNSFPHRKVEEQPNKKPTKDAGKSAVAIVKSVRQLSCVSQDTEPPESVSISRRGKKVLGPIRRVRFTRAALRQANIRQKGGPSLRSIQVKIPHHRSHNAMKFEDRSPGETARQERCAPGDLWRLAKNIYKLKETDKATFFSPNNEWCLPAPSTIKPVKNRVCGGLQSKHAYGQQERPELSRIGNRKSL